MLRPPNKLPSRPSVAFGSTFRQNLSPLRVLAVRSRRRRRHLRNRGRFRCGRQNSVRPLTECLLYPEVPAREGFPPAPSASAKFGPRVEGRFRRRRRFLTSRLQGNPATKVDPSPERRGSTLLRRGDEARRKQGATLNCVRPSSSMTVIETIKVNLIRRLFGHSAKRASPQTVYA